MSKTDKLNYYVDPKDFKEAIKSFYETDKFENYLGECINKIAAGLSYNSKFRDYTYRDDMVGDAIIKMYAALKNKNFDVNSEYNPFSYFTTIAFRAFINRIKKEKRLHKAESEYKEREYERYMIEESDGFVYTGPTGDGDDSYYDESAL
jgi:DNA-directed RNA polymerase specialized sigma24 family protein